MRSAKLRTAAEWHNIAVEAFESGDGATSVGYNTDAVGFYTRAQAAAAIATSLKSTPTKARAR